MISISSTFTLMALTALGQTNAVAKDGEQVVVEAVARMAVGEEAPASVSRFFRKDATFAKGDQRTPWDADAFQRMVKAQCGRRWSYWSQDRVLFGLADNSAAELRSQGHPQGPGLTFHCRTNGNFIGHAMYTFKFEKGAVAEVRELFILQPPAPPPPSAGGTR